MLGPSSWNKARETVFFSSNEANRFGPGYNCFTVSADGSEDVIVYHARNYKEVAGDLIFVPERGEIDVGVSKSFDGKGSPPLSVFRLRR